MLLRTYFFYAKRFLLWIGFLCTLFFFDRMGGARWLRGEISPVLSPIRAALYWVQAQVRGEFDRVFLWQQQRDSFVMLKYQLDTAVVDQTELARLREENISLRKLLELPLEPRFRLTPTHIISKDGTTIQIMLGTKHGVTQEMLVLVDEILYGLVVTTELQTAQFHTLLGFESDFPVTVINQHQDRIPALMNVKEGKVYLQGIVMSDIVQAGDLVVTRGDQGIIPGITIGKLQSVVIDDETSVYKSAVVSWPLADVAPTTVEVLTGW